jgi:N-acetylglucosaminyl-diphospho-decaprenol L-rhamnosyltransferase
MQKIKATILILDYFKAVQIVENVRTLLGQAVDFSYKIIVIDNSCDAHNAEILEKLFGLPNVKLVMNKENIGYIKAHNAVKNEIEGEYVLIVNPDIIWPESTVLTRLVSYMDNHPDVGVLGPKQTTKEGGGAMTVRAFPKFFVQVARRTFLRHFPVFRSLVAHDERQDLAHDKTQDVDWLQSSFFVVRKDLWDAVGGFDEDYFLFMADVETCWQAWKRGSRVVYLPEVTVFEDGRRASQGGFLQFFRSWVLRQHVKDSLRFRWKHLFEPNPRRRKFKN